MRSTYGLITIAALAATACGGGGTGMAGAPAGDSATAAATRAAADTIRSLDEQWSTAAGRHDAQAFTAFYAADGMIMPPDMPAATGSDAIQKLVSGLLADTTTTLSFQPVDVHVAASNGMAWEHGTWAMTTAAGTPAAAGKYVVVWKRGTDGSWKVAADIFNSNAPAPAPAKK